MPTDKTPPAEAAKAPEPAAAPPDDGLHAYIVVHSDPAGKLFATRVRASSRGDAHLKVSAVHADNLIHPVYEDHVGTKTIAYEGHDDLTVADLMD